MKISEKWLREWVSPRLDTKTLASRLTMAGLEVSTIEPMAPDLSRVVVGEILSIAPHPAAGRLQCCRVRIGKTKSLNVVCGASNAAVGVKAPLALPGATLPNGVTVRQSEIHGVESGGMLCSGQELGLEDSSDGLFLLEGEAKAGTPLKTYLSLDDKSLEIDLTPNRGDCLSVLGIAREVTAITGVKLKGQKIKNVPPKSRRKIRVTLRAAQDCPHYVGRVIEDINPHAVTPIWMKERLRRSGLRSIHPVVDVTNYVMLELGQPMHAFDLDKLAGGITVRLAKKGEALMFLDGNKAQMKPDNLLIADEKGPLALAGVMGGADSAVTETTHSLFLESAFFRPEIIARQARRLDLQTESSQRFERGVDPALQYDALQRATGLLLQIVGGKPGPVIEQTAKRYLPKPVIVSLRAERIPRVLGLRLATNRVEMIMKRLGMRVKKMAGGWRVVPPLYRFDLVREVDLIEELARIHGYETLPSRLPQAPMPLPSLPEARIEDSRLRALLVDRDYQEVITYSFIDPALQALLEPQTRPAMLTNPISANMAAMRTSLWPGLLQAMTYNQNRQQTRMRLFEIGRRFVPRAGSIDQNRILAGAISGNALAEQWGVKARPADFYDVKADLEALIRLSGRLQDFRFAPAQHPALQPGQTAAILNRGRQVGLMGRLHPSVQSKLALDREVVLFEIQISAINVGKIPNFYEIPRFPAIRRDLAVIVAEKTPAQAVLDCVTKVAGKLLVNLELFDEYRGEGIDSGRKSLALSLTLQDSSRTLKEEEVEAIMGKVVSSLEAELQARLRH
ncbi:MAG: phenylalanine--tRNA ligase subunit beta [Gammaproteobacteria bacterium]|nr:MAG: phenylalanine--tRNA ligase subunit beta [Gammaproteobacteria bacterium]